MVKEVIVYSTAECPWCKKVKDFLKENKVRFTNKDVGDDQKSAEEMIEKSGQQGVPVIVIGGKEVIIGFDEDKLKAVLGL